MTPEADLVTEEVGSSVCGVDRRVDGGRGSDGSSTGLLPMPASRVSRDWCCPDGRLVLGGGPVSGNEWIGGTAGVEIAEPGIETGRLVEVGVTVDDWLEVGGVPTEGGGSISDTLGEGKDDVVVEETGRSGRSTTVARVGRDDCGTGGILERDCMVVATASSRLSAF